MVKVIRRIRPQATLQSYRSQFTSFHAARMDLSLPLEEERLPCYSPDQFYPIHPGQILDSNYKVLAKLGYGAHSTVWLCRNERDAGFVTIKVCTRDGDQLAHVQRELQFYKHVSSLNSQHHGQSFIRGLLDAFEITGPTGQHLCLVHLPMHMTLQELQYIDQSHKLNEPLLKWTLSNILNALSFLHDEAKVIHTDINASNIMVTVADESVLADIEKAEAQNSLPRKAIDNVRTIYSTHKLGLPNDSLRGEPVLCDFGEAQIGEGHKRLIQPQLYRAPEVLFDMKSNSAANIWSVAALAWDLLENRHLFNVIDEDRQSSATHHIAEIVAYLGLPPLKYIQRSEITKKVFGKRVSTLDGESKELFLTFMRAMLEWLPEKRKRASELLEDPWMKEQCHSQ
ncbi:non-specific serine/threonine protein kinase [Massariosphaeria phaeospora]|uniref:non-specific serine/threonine protein kinase n=1 Tax=Massariosphaeria phaeospora TaxID=100035 RepID=A0A7C8IDI2_9PLEO|nr:non-specific serine/threonine protein kinase [Massariosphaeria phaeospora]